jgi:predicted nucleic acid-binding protein
MRIGQRAFVDSNVFLYHLESHEPAKAQLAARLISNLRGNCVISVQVMQEVYSVAIRKALVPPQMAREYVEEMGRRHVVLPDQKLVLAAIDTSERNRINFYDALIIEAAVTAKCDLIYTEDMNHGQVIRGVRIENPFISAS